MSEVLDFTDSESYKLIGSSVCIQRKQISVRDFFLFLTNELNDKNIQLLLEKLKSDCLRTFFKTIHGLIGYTYFLDLDIEVFSQTLLNTLPNLNIDIPSMIFLNSNYLFNMTYHEINVKPYLLEMNRFLKRAYPILSYRAAHCENHDKWTLGTRKLKVGIVSQQMNLQNISSVFKDRSEIIKRLNENIFEKYFIISSQLNTSLKETRNKHLFKELHNCFHAYYVVDFKNLEKSINYVANLKLDIIIYPSIGMDTLSIIFPHLRLAPIQINTWGHSVTSGNPSIDYYISSIFYEPNDKKQAQEHYSEKLISLRSLCTYYIPKNTSSITKNFNEVLGLPQNKKILFCLQSPSKLNRRFLSVLDNIVMKLGNAIVLLLQVNETSLPENRKRINDILHGRAFFVQRDSWATYAKYIKQSDLILDTYPTGGCNSTLDAFMLNKVVVCCPTQYLRGRFTAGFYQKMNIGYPIAKNLEEYEHKAIELMRNNILRKSIEDNIEKHKHLLFQDQESVDDWNNVLIQLADKHLK